MCLYLRYQDSTQRIVSLLTEGLTPLFQHLFRSREPSPVLSRSIAFLYPRSAPRQLFVSNLFSSRYIAYRAPRNALRSSRVIYFRDPRPSSRFIVHVTFRASCCYPRLALIYLSSRLALELFTISRVLFFLSRSASLTSSSASLRALR